jgi:phosphoribosylformylglycinamidine synthase
VPEFALDLYRSIYQAVQQGFVLACHDLSEGGLAVAAAEMCIGGRTGMDLGLETEDEFIFFREANAALLVEVSPQDLAAFEACFGGPQGAVVQRIGTVSAEPVLRIANRGGGRIELPVTALVEAQNAVRARFDPACYRH